MKSGKIVEVKKGNPDLLLELDRIKESIEKRATELAKLRDYFNQVQIMYETGKLR